MYVITVRYYAGLWVMNYIYEYIIVRSDCFMEQHSIVSGVAVEVVVVVVVAVVVLGGGSTVYATCVSD